MAPRRQIDWDDIEEKAGKISVVSKNLERKAKERRDASGLVSDAIILIKIAAKILDASGLVSDAKEMKKIAEKIGASGLVSDATEAKKVIQRIRASGLVSD